MPLRQPSCRKHLLHSDNALSNHVWISDRQLAAAYIKFVGRCARQQRRHGSSAPGPLEAQRRLAKRKIGGLTSHHGPAAVDVGALFGLPWVKQGVEQREKPRQWRTEPGPIFMALFGPREKEEFSSHSGIPQKAVLESEATESVAVKQLLADGASLEDVLDHLRDISSVDSGRTEFLDFLECTNGIKVPTDQFSHYRKSLEQALVLGVVGMQELQQILHRVPTWMEKQWRSNEQRNAQLAALLDAVYVGTRDCRVQQLDALTLHTMRTIIDAIIHVPGMSALRYSLYCQSWPCPDQSSATSEQQILYWLNLVRHENLRPQAQPDPLAMHQRHLQDVIDHFHDSEYDQQRLYSTGVSIKSKTSTTITNVTKMLCANVRPFLDKRSALDKFEETDNTDLRRTWLKLLMSSEIFQQDTQDMPLHGTIQSKHEYWYPQIWFDVFGAITQRLPLDAFLDLMPSLNAIQCCRLFSVFSFGPTESKVRLSLNNNFSNGRARALFQQATTAFEQAVDVLGHQNHNEADFAVFSAYISALTEAGFRNRHQVFLVACQRITRLISRLHDPNHALSFILSQPFQEAIDRHNPAISVEIRLQLAAEIFPDKSQKVEWKAFVRRLWLHLKNTIRLAQSGWHKIRADEPMSYIMTSHVAGNFQRLLSELAPHVAADATITDRSSWQIVHYLSVQLQRRNLKIDNAMRHAMVISALTRSLTKSRVPAYNRVNYLLQMLQKSGLDENTLNRIDKLLVEWRSAIRDGVEFDQISLRPQADPDSYVHHLPFIDKAHASENTRKVREDRHESSQALGTSHVHQDTARLQLAMRPADEMSCAIRSNASTGTSPFESQGIRIVQFQSRIGTTVVTKPKPTRFARIARSNLAMIKSQSSSTA